MFFASKGACGGAAFEGLDNHLIATIRDAYAVFLTCVGKCFDCGVSCKHWVKRGVARICEDNWDFTL